MAMRSSPNAYTRRNKLTIIRGGADFFDKIEQIANESRYSLHLQTYIYDEDETGARVAEALKRAARRGVTVYVLLDGYASGHLSNAFITGLKEAGINFGFFAPFFRGGNFYIGRRLHHKVIVADSSVCMVAGINISNRYNDIGAVQAWLDWAVYAEGEVAQDLNDICVRIWNRSVFRKKCVATAREFRRPLPDTNCLVRVRRNDWVYRRTEITRSYREIFPQARKQVIIMTSYFWPPQKLLRGIASATARGTRVCLVLTAKSDIPVAKYAERYLYAWLFRNSVEIYEYQRNVLHGKIAVRDNEWFTAGSYNVNNISAYASVELNLDVDNRELATHAGEILEKVIADDCKRIVPDEFRTHTNLFQKLMFYLSYRLVHFVFYIFTFYFVQKRENY